MIHQSGRQRRGTEQRGRLLLLFNFEIVERMKQVGFLVFVSSFMNRTKKSTKLRGSQIAREEGDEIPEHSQEGGGQWYAIQMAEISQGSNGF